MRIDEAYKTENENFLFVRLSREIERYKRENPDVEFIDLGVGDVKLPPVKTVSKAIIKAAKMQARAATFKGYSPDFGYDFLRKKISDDYKLRGADVKKDEIFINDGAKRAICDVVEIVRPKTALILSPAYPLYKDMCALSGVKTVMLGGDIERGFFLPPEKLFEKSPEESLEKLSENSPEKLPENFVPDIIFICSPSNPTGDEISRKILEKYVDFALKNGSLILLDGAYAAFSGRKDSVYSIDGAEAVVAEIRSYSKSLSFTGMRCGYTVIKSENPLYKPMRKHQLLHSNGVSFISQFGAAAAYSKKARKELDNRINEYKKSARIISSFLNKAEAIFTGGENAPYIFLKTPFSGRLFATKLLYARGVAVTPGDGFGAENFIRISCFCGEKQAKIAGERISSFMLEIK